MSTFYQQGQEAGREWISSANMDAPEPTNPHPRPNPRTGEPGHAYLAWHAGYAAAIYAEFGDPDRDAERAERAFGC